MHQQQRDKNARLAYEHVDCGLSNQRISLYNHQESVSSSSLRCDPRCDQLWVVNYLHWVTSARQAGPPTAFGPPQPAKQHIHTHLKVSNDAKVGGTLLITDRRIERPVVDSAPSISKQPIVQELRKQTSSTQHTKKYYSVGLVHGKGGRTSEGCLERLEERHADDHERHHHSEAHKHRVLHLDATTVSI